VRTSDTRFEERLIPMLRDAVTQGVPATSRRPRRTRVLILAATIGVVLVGALLGGGAAIGRRELVMVNGSEAIADPSQVEAELQQAGIDADIIPVPLPSTPSHYWQGRWWWLTFDGPSDLDEEEHGRLFTQVGLGSSLPGDQPQIENATTLEIPKGIEAKMTLYVTFEVPRDSFTVDAYDRINELSPIGAFRCLGLDPDDPVGMGRTLSAIGYEVLWLFEPAGNRGGAGYGEVVEPPDGTAATWAWFRSPTVVDVRLMDASATKAVERYRHAEGTFTPDEAPPFTVPCT